MVVVRLTVRGRAVAKKDAHGTPKSSSAKREEHKRQARIRRYERLVAKLARPHFARVSEGRFRVWGDFWCIDSAELEVGDADNLISTVMDALKGIAYIDDRQVKDERSQVHQASSEADERAEIEIEEIGGMVG